MAGRKAASSRQISCFALVGISNMYDTHVMLWGRGVGSVRGTDQEQLVVPIDDWSVPCTLCKGASPVPPTFGAVHGAEQEEHQGNGQRLFAQPSDWILPVVRTRTLQ